MSGRNPASERGESIARDVRPLPSAPSLEYERKEAKALLKQIHAGDPDALRRLESVHPVALRGRRPGELKLADAQHLIAREYGFTSWPRLVEYFAELERHRNSPRYHSPEHPTEWFERSVQSIVRRHSQGDTTVANELSHFVPPFYRRSTAEVLSARITEHEARLVVARRHGRASWDELIELAAESRAHVRRNAWQRADAPMGHARAAMRNQDVDALAAILDEHPELFTPSQIEREWRESLAGMALSFERKLGTAVARRITDLVASRGVDVQGALNERLLGWPQDGSRPEVVQWYLDRGADPNWMPPNGITVLEHAIVRYQNGECVDLIADRVTPRHALWIAAGLGDVPAVRSFIARKGKLTPEGRENRPDMIAIGGKHGTGCPPSLEADDLAIMWEAFRIAGWNGRWAAMDALLEAGLPVDHATLGMPLVLEAVGRVRDGLPLLEYLVSRGADLDREWAFAGGSVRSYARSMVESLHTPRTESVRRMLQICSAGTVEEILAEREATRLSPPPPDEWTMRVMQLAADDAGRQGQSTVTTENLLVGLLRVRDGAFADFVMVLGADMPELRDRIRDRLLPDVDPLTGQELPADTLADAAVQAAVAEADSRHRASVQPLHLLLGILGQEAGSGARLLAEVGASKGDGWERLMASL